MAKDEYYVLDDAGIDGEGIEIQDTHVGKGVFATRDFPIDSIIGPITGEHIDDPRYESDYCIWLGDSHHLEPAAPFRFLNHCCEANCDFDVFEVEETDEAGATRVSDHVFLFATRNIYDGEQLTLDYAWPADAAIPCKCEAPTCRGWVVCETELGFLQSGEC